MITLIRDFTTTPLPIPKFFLVVYLLNLRSECLVSYDPHFHGNDGTKKLQQWQGTTSRDHWDVRRQSAPTIPPTISPTGKLVETLRLVERLAELASGRPSCALLCGDPGPRAVGLATCDSPKLRINLNMGPVTQPSSVAGHERHSPRKIRGARLHTTETETLKLRW